MSKYSFELRESVSGHIYRANAILTLLVVLHGGDVEKERRAPLEVFGLFEFLADTMRNLSKDLEGEVVADRAVLAPVQSALAIANAMQLVIAEFDREIPFSDITLDGLFDSISISIDAAQAAMNERAATQQLPTATGRTQTGITGAGDIKRRAAALRSGVTAAMKADEAGGFVHSVLEHAGERLAEVTSALEVGDLERAYQALLATEPFLAAAAALAKNDMDHALAAALEPIVMNADALSTLMDATLTVAAPKPAAVKRAAPARELAAA